MDFKHTKSVFFILAGLLFGDFQAQAALPNLFISDGDNVDVFNGSSLNTNFISINGAGGLSVGVDGSLYAASQDDAQVYRYNASTGALTGTFVPFLGSNDPGSVQGPAGLAWGPDNHLYIADITASNVHVYTNTGVSSARLGGPSLDQPVNVGFNPAGNLFAVDNLGVEEFDAGSGQFVSYIQAISGGGSYVLNAPSAVALSSTGNTFVLDVSGSSSGILKFTGNTFNSQIVNFNITDFVPASLIMGPDSKLYVSGVDLDTGIGEVLSFNPDGSGESVYASGLNNPTFMSFGVPEPSTNLLLLGGVGLAALGTHRRRAAAR